MGFMGRASLGTVATYMPSMATFSRQRPPRPIEASMRSVFPSLALFRSYASEIGPRQRRLECRLPSPDACAVPLVVSQWFCKISCMRIVTIITIGNEIRQHASIQ